MLEGSILQKLRDAHQPGQSGKRPLNFGVYYKNTLVSLCHALEDCILECSSAPLVVTAFQRGKWYLEEAERYGQIADRAHQIVIMAAPDSGFAEHATSQRSNVALVPLESADPVAQEWHLMILAPTYTAMVLCQELTPEDYGKQGIPTVDLERKFYGFWTFEASLVQETVELAVAHVQSYEPALAERLRSQVEQIAAAPGDRDEIYTAVSQVVNYLQVGQTDLSAQQPRRHETLDNNLISNELQALLRLAQLIDQSDVSNPMAAAEVTALAEAMAQLLDLPAWQMNRLRLAGLLHRVGFLQTSGSVLPPSVPLAGEGPSCPLAAGTHILRTMQRLKAIATIITHQTEHWNGSGQPAGLSGDAIPLESRILGLLAEFQQHVVQSGDVAQAFAACQAGAGDRWDPKLVDALAILVSALQQGLNLQTSLPKIAAGMWLLDSHSDEELLAMVKE
jgi:DICT domain-containing protein